METRANYAIIGIFTIAVIAAAFGFVFWFSGSDSGAKKTAYRVDFTSSVAGLSKGASVLFNGIRVGEVVDVDFNTDPPNNAFARIEVRPDTPVTTGTKASLDTQLLSGAAVIALTGGSGPKLERTDKQPLPTIAAERGGLGDLMATARTTADEATKLITSLRTVVDQNAETINTTIGNLQTFSKALSDNAPAVNEALASVGDAAKRIGPLAARLETLADETTTIVRAVEPARVNRVVRNVEDLTQTLVDNRGRVATILTDAASLMNRLNEAAPKIEGALTSFNAAAESIAPAAGRLGGLAEDARNVVRSVEPGRVARIVENVDGVMATVGESRERVAEVVRNTASLTQRLNESAPKLDSFLTTLARVAENLNPLAARLSTVTDAIATRVQAVDPEQVRQAVAGANQFMTGLAASTPEVQSTIRNANELTGKLSRSADLIEGLVKSAQDFLGSAAGQEGKSTFEAVRLAAVAFEKASNNLDRRATEIAQGVSRFSGVGSRQVEALGNDARRAVNSVGRAATTLERNPSSVIFGTGRASIPEFGGR